MVTRLLRLDDYSSSTTAANSFETINCPNGTDPIADSATDTLNLTSSDSSVSITGTAATDTVDFVVVGKQPLDATLTALAAYNTNGLLTQTAADTFTGRTIVTATSGVTITNGSGVAGNPSIDIADASSGSAGLVTTGNQTWAGRKSFNGSVVLNANLNYAWTQDAAATGANANLTNHPTVGVEVTNASLTSVAKIDSTSTSAGHMIIVRNKTGAAITIVNEVDVSGDQIVTGTGANVTLANNASMTFIRDRTASFWAVVAVSSGVTAHNQLTGLTSGDDHTQYALLAGRSGGQTLTGGTASGNNLTLISTSNATKGKVILGTASAYDQVNDRLGIGVTSPSVKVHQDGGNATATYHKFTAGSTTGTGSADGFDIGIDASANGEVRLRENTYLTFYTNNTGALRIKEDQRVIVGDVNEGAPFLPTTDQMFLANKVITSIGSSFSPVDFLKVLSCSSANIEPFADTNSGAIGFSIYAAQGFTTNANGTHNFNGGLDGVAGSAFPGLEPLSVFGAFGQVNVNTSGSVDGGVGLLCSIAHYGYTATGATDVIFGGDFAALSDGSGGPTMGGTLNKLIGARFTAWISGVSPTTAIAGRFYEPDVFDAGAGFGTPAQPTNKTAIECRGTLTILESTVASAASITNMAVDSSFVYLTGSTATTLHGIKPDAFNKILYLVNETGANLTVKHNSASAASTAAKIYTSTGADVVSAGNSRHMFIWSTTKNGWILMGGDL